MYETLIEYAMNEFKLQFMTGTSEYHGCQTSEMLPILISFQRIRSCMGTNIVLVLLLRIFIATVTERLMALDLLLYGNKWQTLALLVCIT